MQLHSALNGAKMSTKNSIASLKRKKWVIVEFDSLVWNARNYVSKIDKERYRGMVNWCENNLDKGTYRGSIANRPSKNKYSTTPVGTTRFAFLNESVASLFLLKFK